MRVCMLFLKIYVTFVRREQKRMNKRENNMKRFLYLTVCLLILGEFYGCNGDVFVDDFRPSDSELALDLGHLLPSDCPHHILYIERED